MAPRPLEYCCACDAPTGRAGQGEDSLYTSSGDLGPYCEDCWDDVEFWREHADTLLDQSDALRRGLLEIRRRLAEMPGVTCGMAEVIDHALPSDSEADHD